MEFCIRRKIDNTGRIVIPRDIRNFYNIKSGDTLIFIAEQEGLTIKIIPQKNKAEEASKPYPSLIKNQQIFY